MRQKVDRARSREAQALWDFVRSVLPPGSSTPPCTAISRRTGLPKQTISDWFARGAVPAWEKYQLFLGYFDASHHRRLNELWIAARRAETTETAEAAEPRPPEHPGAAVPRELPGGVVDLVGRADGLRALDALLPDPARRRAGPVVVSICGPAGIGKTTLAVHWARHAREHFRDGQLYVDLHGYSQEATPTTATAALARLLRSLGVPNDAVPPDEEGRAALFRTRTDGRRLLILLDNARDSDHVRPLLPAADSCLVLTTSRRQLTSLVAKEQATLVGLGLLNAAESRELLARFVGATRLSAHAAAVDDIVRHCGGLPLALSVAGARASTTPAAGLDTLAADLRDEHRRLDALRTADSVDTDVRSVFSWSCRALPSEPARLFRLLGLHPGPHVTVRAAACLAGVPLDVAERHLALLASVHLVTATAPGRFGQHDLLRTFAAQTATTAGQDRENGEAIRRCLDHYAHTGRAAAALLDPARPPLDLDPPLGPDATAPLAGIDDAWAWLDDEHPVIVAMSAVAARAGLHGQAWQLLWTVGTYLDRRGRWHELVSTQHAALAAARAAGDRAAQAFACRGLGRAHMRLASVDDAHRHYSDALELYRQLGDRTGQAHAYLDLGWVDDQRRRHEEALRHARRALELFEAVGDRRGLATALNSVGWEHSCLGRHREALDACRRALELHRALGNRRGQAETWDSLGHVRHQLGEHADALADYRKAIEGYRELGERCEEANCLRRLGDTLQALGDTAGARRSREAARRIDDELRRRPVNRGAGPAAGTGAGRPRRGRVR